MDANDLISKYKTRNPYTIARLENIIILEGELGDLYGYYHEVLGKKIIHMHEDLPDYFHRYVVAHLLHPAVNNLKNLHMIKRKSSYEYSKEEIAANKFAIELMVDEDELKELGYEGLMIKYKMSVEDIADLQTRLSSVLVKEAPLDELMKTVLTDFKNGEERYGKN